MMKNIIRTLHYEDDDGMVHLCVLFFTQKGMTTHFRLFTEKK